MPLGVATTKPKIFRYSTALIKQFVIGTARNGNLLTAFTDLNRLVYTLYGLVMPAV